MSISSSMLDPSSANLHQVYLIQADTYLASHKNTCLLELDAAINTLFLRLLKHTDISNQQEEQLLSLQKDVQAIFSSHTANHSLLLTTISNLLTPLQLTDQTKERLYTLLNFTSTHERVDSDIGQLEKECTQSQEYLRWLKYQSTIEKELEIASSQYLSAKERAWKIPSLKEQEEELKKIEIDYLLKIKTIQRKKQPAPFISQDLIEKTNNLYNFYALKEKKEEAIQETDRILAPLTKENRLKFDSSWNDLNKITQAIKTTYNDTLVKISASLGGIHFRPPFSDAQDNSWKPINLAADSVVVASNQEIASLLYDLVKLLEKNGDITSSPFLKEPANIQYSEHYLNLIRGVFNSSGKIRQEVMNLKIAVQQKDLSLIKQRLEVLNNRIKKPAIPSAPQKAIEEHFISLEVANDLRTTDSDHFRPKNFPESTPLSEEDQKTLKILQVIHTHFGKRNPLMRPLNNDPSPQYLEETLNGYVSYLMDQAGGDRLFELISQRDIKALEEFFLDKPRDQGMKTSPAS